MRRPVNCYEQARKQARKLSNSPELLSADLPNDMADKRTSLNEIAAKAKELSRHLLSEGVTEKHLQPILKQLMKADKNSSGMAHKAALIKAISKLPITEEAKWRLEEYLCVR